jgi:hypothetical protein
VTAGPRAPDRPGALGAIGDTPVVRFDSGLKYFGGEVYR